MKRVIMFFVFLISVVSYAQEQTNTKFEKVGDEIEVTYYYENGVVKQHGFFNENGKLQGTWTSYNIEGDKLAIGNYDNGQKVGKWFFWSDDTLKEVDFIESKIANVNEWKSSSKLAIRN
jgi:antitoxin component YwqK of YwqJK toxin-antitoxin module